MRKLLFAVTGVLALAVAIPVAAQKANTPKKPRLASLDANAIAYIRPGIKVKILSASIAKDGTITARVKVTDPKDVPLDRDGITTAGPISISLMATYIPNGQKQWVSYTTRLVAATFPGNKNPSQSQAGTDSGGTFTKNADGDYTYVFKTKAPVNFDPTVTHGIGVSAVRDLSEFMESDEWDDAANDVFLFVPDGSAVKTTRDVVPTSACNQCHSPMYGHGGSRVAMEYCIMCHTPQTINPDTTLTQDMPVLIHKIHMGKNLPSVKAGTPYRIWHRGAWSDFSEVGFPSGTDELMTCTVCHQGKTAQVDAWKTNPTRAACGACHDDVDFTTGKNHVNLPQTSDANCTQCHKADLGGEYDASVVGSHVVATRSKQRPGVNFELIRVDNTKPGDKPTVTFAVRDNAGGLYDMAKFTRLSLVIAGPTTDFNGYITEALTGANTKIAGGVYTYTFTTPLPATAKGTFTVGIEGYNNFTINPNTVNSAVVRDIGMNKQLNFTVTDAKPVARRAIVSDAKCNSCHERLFFHGGNRLSVNQCVLCHNPGVDDSSQRKAGDKPESINLKTMIHKIHTGKELTTDFTVLGRNASVNNYNEVGYVGDRRNCEQCHLPNTYTLPLPETALGQISPRDYLTTQGPATAACLSCHTTKAAAAHASLQTSPTLGESCEACHGPNGEAAVAKVHK